MYILILFIVCLLVTMLWKRHGLFVYCLFTCDDAVEVARIGGEVGVVAVGDSFVFLAGATGGTQTCKLPKITCCYPGDGTDSIILD